MRNTTNLDAHYTRSGDSKHNIAIDNANISVRTYTTIWHHHFHIVANKIATSYICHGKCNIHWAISLY